MKKKTRFTPEGYKNLEYEYTELKKTKRPQAVDRLQKARSMGDLSENSEYSAAKEDLAFVEGRIREVEELMNQAEVIDPQATEGVSIGNNVVVEKDGDQLSFTIVGEFEADPMNKKLSTTSPIGKALLGKKQGETVHVKAPAGTIQYVIKEIKEA